MQGRGKPRQMAKRRPSAARLAPWLAALQYAAATPVAQSVSVPKPTFEQADHQVFKHLFEQPSEEVYGVQTFVVWTAPAEPVQTDSRLFEQCLNV